MVADATQGAVTWRTVLVGFPRRQAGDGPTEREYRRYKAEVCGVAGWWLTLWLALTVGACLASACLGALPWLVTKAVAPALALGPPLAAMAWLLTAPRSVQLVARGYVLLLLYVPLRLRAAPAPLWPPFRPWRDLITMTAGRALGNLCLALLSPACHLPSLRWQLGLNAVALPVLWAALPDLLGRFTYAPVPPALAGLITAANVLVAVAVDMALRRRFVLERQRPGSAGGTGGAAGEPSGSSVQRGGRRALWGAAPTGWSKVKGA